MDLKTGNGKYYFDIDRCRLNIICKYVPDSTELVLFIHGLACSWDSFRNVLDKDYFPGKSLLLPDLAGFGDSSKPEDFSYTMENQAHLIDNLLANFPNCNIHIAAHSMGGAIALLLNEDTLSRVKTFSNIEGNLIGEDCGMLSRGVISVNFTEYCDNLYKKHLIEFNGHHQLRFEKTDPLVIYKSADSLVKWSDSGELLCKFKSLNCRKCYFYGEENNNMPVLKKLGPIEKFMISKSGHGLMTENPDEFYTKLKSFVG